MNEQTEIKPAVEIKPYTPERIKLALTFCSNRPMEPRCALALAMMVHHLTTFGVPFAIICRLQASLLPQTRQECLDEALTDDCTHQFWWDDDVEPPADCVNRMLHTMRSNPQVDILVGNYCRKQDTLQYTAENLDGSMTESFGKIGIEEIDKAGMGLMLVKLEKLKNIPAPHFEVCWSEEHKKYRGEDRYFTRKVREHGMRIFVDHGISNWTQHWGNLGYNFSMFKPKHSEVKK